MELVKDVSAAHLLNAGPLERLCLVRNAVLKLHLPVLLNFWQEDFLRNRSKYPILNNMKNSSLDFVIILICFDKNVIDSIMEITDDYNDHLPNSVLLATVVAMKNILASRSKCLEQHLMANFEEIDQILNIKFVTIFNILPMPLPSPEAIRPIDNRSNVWEKIFKFTSFNELKESTHDSTCSICINAKDIDDEFAILSNCRHIFCVCCICNWFEQDR